MTALNLRSLSKDFIVYGIGEVLVRAFSFITLPIYTRLFAPEEFGVYSLVMTALGLVNAILILGGDSAYARYFFEARTRSERQLVTSTWFSFLVAWAAALVAISLPLAGQLSDRLLGTDGYAILIVLALLSAPVSLLNRMCAQALRNEYRALTFSVLNVASMALSVGASVVAVVVLDMGLAGILAGLLAAETIMLPARLWVTRDLFGFVFSPRLLRGLLAYGIPLVPTSLSYWVFLTSDRVLLGQLSTLEQVGLYSVAASLVGLSNMAIAAFSQAWTARSIQAYEASPADASRLFGRMMTMLLAAFGFLCVALTAFASELLAVLTQPAFYGAAAAVPPLAIGMVAYASTSISSSGIGLMKRTSLLALAAGAVAALNVVLNLVLIPPFGMVGSAWATAISYITLTVVLLVVAQRLWAVAYEVRSSILTIGLIAIFTAAASLTPAELSLAGVLLKVGICLAFVPMLFAVGALGPRDSAAARTLLGLIWRRLDPGRRARGPDK